MNERRMSLGNRILSLVLALVMVIGMMPAGVLSVFAADTTGNPNVTSNADTILQYAQNMLNNNYKATGDFDWVQEDSEDGWRYYNGVMLQAFLQNGLKASDSKNAYDFAKLYFDYHINESGNTYNDVLKEEYSKAEEELDGIPPARNLAQLVGHAGFTDDKYSNAVKVLYENTINQKKVDGTNNNFMHKETATNWKNWQIGLDGVYMAEPFLMEVAKAVKEGRVNVGATYTDIADGVYTRISWIATKMRYTTPDGVYLYHHGWGPEDGYNEGNGITWSRGEGWWVAGLADCIALMEDIGYDSTKIETLKGYLKEAIDGLLKYQDPTSGLWYNVIYVKSTNKYGADVSDNFLEVSGTGLFAYAIMKAYTRNWVTDKSYGEAALKAIDGIMGSETYYSSSNGFQKIQKSASVYTDPTAYNSSTKNEAKGIGPIIMAASMYDDVKAKVEGGSQYTETFTIGDVYAPAGLVIPVGGDASDIDYTKVFVTVLGSKGTIKKLTVSNGASFLVTGDTSAAGTAEVTAYYGENNPIGTFTVNVVDADSATTATGSVSAGGDGTYYAPYKEDTIENGNYVIVHKLTDTTGLALKNNGSTTNNSDRTAAVTYNSGEVTFDNAGDTAASVWTISASNSGYKIFNQISGDNNYYYIRTGDSNPIARNTNSSSIASVGVSRTSPNSNIYEIDLGSSNKMYYNGTKWTRSTSVNGELLFFKETIGSKASVTLSVEPTIKELAVDDSYTYTPTVKVGDTTLKVGEYTLVWSSGSESVVTVENGEVTAVSGGSAAITATLTHVKVDDNTELTKLDEDIEVTVTVNVPAAACDHNYESAVTAPTCTNKGYTTYTCSKCGTSYTGNETAAAGHSYGEGVETLPDCTTDGYITYTCSVCGHSYREAGTASQGHNYVNGTCTYCQAIDPSYVAPGIESITAPNNTTGKATIQVDGTLQLTANTVGGATVTWSSGNDAIATVSDTGLVIGVSAGKVTITATVVTASRATNSATFEVTVTEVASGDEVAAPVTGSVTTTISGSAGGTKEYEIADAQSDIAAGNYVITGEDATCYFLNSSLSGSQVTWAAGSGTGKYTTSTENVTIWTLEAAADGGYYIYFNDGSNNQYLTNSSGRNLTLSTTKTTRWNITWTSGNNFNVTHANGTSDRDDLDINGSTVKFETSAKNLYFYKEISTGSGSGTPTNYDVALSASDISMTVGQTGVSAAKPSITVEKATDGTEATPTSYAVTYEVTGGDDCITITSDGAITANSAGTAHVTATLSTIDMGDGDDVINTPATVTFKVVVENSCEHVNKDAAVRENEVSATCGEAGSYDSVVYCSDCGAEISRTEVTVDATGEHSYTDVVTAPTCTAGGYTTYTCSVCGDTYTGNETSATGHSYTSAVTDPTCTEEGYTTHTCSKCGVSYTDTTVPANGHTEETIPAVAPTCTETGLTEGKKCSVCGASIQAQTIVAATGHTYGNDDVCDTCGATKPDDGKTYADYYGPFEQVTTVSNNGWYVITAGTNTRTLGYGGNVTNTASWSVTDGEYTDSNKAVQLWKFVLANETENSYYICYIQDNTTYYLVTDTDNYPTVASTLADGVTRWTVTQTGSQVYIKAVNTDGRKDLNVQGSGGAKLEDGDTKLYLFAPVSSASHEHSYTETVTTAATCTTAGVKTFTCSCGDEYTEAIPATGHSYVDGVCSVCGNKETTSAGGLKYQYVTSVESGESYILSGKALGERTMWHALSGSTDAYLTAIEGEEGYYETDSDVNLWTIEKTTNGYYIYNGDTYLRDNGGSLTTGSKTDSGTVWTISDSNRITGQSGKTIQVTSGGAAKLSSSSPTEFFLYKKVGEAVAEWKVEAGDIHLLPGETGTLSATVTYGGAAKTEGTDYTISWALKEGEATNVVTVSGNEVTASNTVVNSVTLVATVKDLEDNVVATTEVKANVYMVVISVPETATINVGENNVKFTPTVTLDGGKPSSFEVEWTVTGDAVSYTVSDNTNTITITGESAGEATLTATLKKVNGKDVTALNKSDATVVTVTENVITAQKLTYTEVFLSVGSTQADLLAALNAIKAEQTWSNGDVTYADLTFSDYSSANLNTANTFTVAASCGDVQLGDITVHVQSNDGYLCTVIYELDVDGIDDGAWYVIVDADKKYALINEDLTGTSSVAPSGLSVSIEGNNVIVAKDKAALCEWLFTQNSDSSSCNRYYIGNGARYLSTSNSSKILSSSSSQMFTTKNATPSDGGYLIGSGGSSGKVQKGLYYTGSTWKFGSGDASDKVYLYKKTSEMDESTSVSFIVTPESTTVGTKTPVGTNVKVSVNGTLTDNYKIEWTVSNTKAEVDEFGMIYGKSAGDATITATLTTANGMAVVNAEGEPLTKEFNITVVEETVEYSIRDLETGKVVESVPLPLHGELDVSKYGLYADSNVDGNDGFVTNGVAFDIAGAKLLSQLNTEDTDKTAVNLGLKTNKPTAADDPYVVKVYLDGKDTGEYLRVSVSDSPYYPREQTDEIIQFPAVGAVRAHKFTYGQDFLNTGVTKIELSAAGVSSKNNVDVILIVDVSNSMGWVTGSYDSTPQNGQINKLKEAMNSANAFAEILLGKDANASTGNTISFVTFAGHDVELSEDGDARADSVKSVFTYEKSFANASKSFSNTSISRDGSTYKITISGTNGTALENASNKQNRGNTNYDFAFGQALSAVDEIKAKYEADTSLNPNGLSYEESGREIQIVFMTDGAASHYNGYKFDASDVDQVWDKSGNYVLVDSDNPYTDTANDKTTNLTWWRDVLRKPNDLATKLYNTPGVAAIHAVGFDLNNGGYGDNHTWNQYQLGVVLEGLVEDQQLPVVLAEDSTSLYNFYVGLAEALTYAGTDAMVNDDLRSTIGSEFTLFTGTQGNEKSQALSSDITIRAYRLYTAADVGTTLYGKTVTQQMVGERVMNGTQYVYDTIETVEFVDGNAQSTTVETTVTVANDGTVTVNTEDVVKANIMTTGDDGSVKIDAVYFDYVKTADGKESFSWNIGNIDDREIVLSYNAYMKNSFDGTMDVPNGIKYTNDQATLEFVDSQGRYVNYEYPVPEIYWGTASVTVRFFMVDQNGNYTNLAGDTFTNPANRVLLTQRSTHSIPMDTPAEILVQEAYANAGIPDNFHLYDNDLIFNVTSPSGSNSSIRWEVTMENGDAVNINSLVEWVDFSGDGVQTVIYVPVVYAEMGSSDQPMITDTVVIDYSSPVEIDVITGLEDVNGYLVDEVEYAIKIGGFAFYNENADLKKYVHVNDYTAVEEGGTWRTDYGTFKVIDATKGIIQFTPTAMLDGTLQVFCTLEMGEKNSTNTWAMHNLVNIVPATVVHYETTGDMANAFTTNGSWTEEKDNTWSETIANQDNANDQYGFDTSYKGYVNFAGGSSLFVNNTNPAAARPSVSFKFTGTGIDIISRTGDKQGLVQMVIMDANGNQVKSVLVLNKGAEDLYQLPVISVEGLEYGTYTATIEVYGEPKHKLYGGQFFLDAIRVYGSAQETEIIGSNAEGNISVGGMYAAAGESKPQIVEVRDILLGNKDFGNISVDGLEGAVYIDGGSTLGEGLFNDYDKIGPNNEVYLSSKQAVAFKLRVEDLEKLPASLDIGLKSVNGSAANALVYVYKDTQTGISPVVNRQITSATAMFYDILGNENITTFLDENNEFYVVIANSGTGILSVTDLKIAYGTAVGNVDIVVDVNVGNVAQETLRASAQVVSAAIDNVDEATQKFIAYAMDTTVIEVVTGQAAQRVEIVETVDGVEKIVASSSFIDIQDGARLWRVLVRLSNVGEHTLTIYGIGTDGNRDESSSQTITVVVRQPVESATTAN